jgi:pimeloyl-ACP methyl ester carboxylesterase
LGAGSVPTTVIAGDQTLAYFVAVADEVARCLPNAQRVVVAGASHDATYLMPAAFNSLLLSHLRAHSGT